VLLIHRNFYISSGKGALGAFLGTMGMLAPVLTTQLVLVLVL